MSPDRPRLPSVQSEAQDARSAARLYAVQALFQMEHSRSSADQVRAEFLDHRFGAELIEGEEMIEGDVDHVPHGCSSRR